MDNRWAIYIDIEGFSTLHANGNDAALWALNRLMLAIYRIGTSTYSQSPNRLFAHQFGDGFLIVSDFSEKSLDRAALITVLLMKFITNFGVFAKAAIAEGSISDISGYYPDEVMNHHNKEGFPIMMGEGLMTITPVMGSALINAVSINKRSPKGPLLTMPSDYKDRLSSIFIVNDIPEWNLISLDWVHTDCNELIDIHKKADLEYPSSENLEKSIRDYVIKHELPSEWITNCSKHLKVENIHNPF